MQILVRFGALAHLPTPTEHPGQAFPAPDACREEQIHRPLSTVP